MLQADQILFVELPGEGGARVLHPGLIHAAGDDCVRVESSERVSVAPGEPVVIYYELRRNFVRQAAEVAGTDAEGGRCMVDIQLTGEPASAEKRTSLRVSTVATELCAEFAGEPRCKVLDVSEIGFSLYASVSREAGTVVDVVLVDEGQEIPGTVLVQSVRPVCAGRVRYGLRCVDGVLKFALAGVNLKAQRQQIRRGRRSRTRGARARQ